MKSSFQFITKRCYTPRKSDQFMEKTTSSVAPAWMDRFDWQRPFRDTLTPIKSDEISNEISNELDPAAQYALALEKKRQLPARSREEQLAYESKQHRMKSAVMKDISEQENIPVAIPKFKSNVSSNSNRTFQKFIFIQFLANVRLQQAKAHIKRIQPFLHSVGQIETYKRTLFEEKLGIVQGKREPQQHQIRKASPVVKETEEVGKPSKRQVQLNEMYRDEVEQILGFAGKGVTSLSNRIAKPSYACHWPDWMIMPFQQIRISHVRTNDALLAIRVYWTLETDSTLAVDQIQQDLDRITPSFRRALMQRLNGRIKRVPEVRFFYHENLLSP